MLKFSPINNLEFEGVKDINPKELADQIGPNIDLVDVRTQGEYTGELSHIKGAKLIPVEELEARTRELNAEKVTVFVCRSGRRSALACQIAKEAGVKECYNLHGGMILWNQEGLPVKE